MTWFDVVELLGYVADAAILLTYALGRLRLFDWANAVGCVPLLVIEVCGRAWPVIPITAVFGVVGWWRVLKLSQRARMIECDDMVTSEPISHV